jgi:hypothetical protein
MAMNINDEIRDQFHEIFYNKFEDITYTLAVKNTTHANLSDWSLFGGLSKMSGLLGSIEGNTCIEILRISVRNFFDRHLKRKDIELNKTRLSQYPEVQIKSRNKLEKYN